MGARSVRLAEKTHGAPYDAGIAVLRHDLRYRPRDFVDIIAVFDGAGRDVVSARGERLVRRLSPGEVALYRPGDDVTLTGARPQGLSIGFVSFPAAEWHSLAAIAGIDPSWMTAPEPPIMAFDPDNAEFRGIFEAAVENGRRGPTPLDLIRFWIDLMPYLFPRASRPGSTDRPAWLVRGVEEMAEEVNLRAGLSRLLELTHVSRSHLALTTRRHLGKTPTDLVTELRLRHAAMLLAEGADSIARIAQRCGYSSPAYFSTSFRRHHRMTPRAYRARARRGSAHAAAATFDLVG